MQDGVMRLEMNVALNMVSVELVSCVDMIYSAGEKGGKLD
jgi:hypothetical protein